MKKYLISFVQSPKEIHDRGDHIYVDVDFKISHPSGIYECSRSSGKPVRFASEQAPVPEWIQQIFKIEGVQSIHHGQYEFSVTYAPLFDRDKVARGIVKVLKTIFVPNERLVRIPELPERESLLPKDLEHKLREIIDEHLHRRRRMHLRDKKAKKPAKKTS